MKSRNRPKKKDRQKRAKVLTKVYEGLGPTEIQRQVGCSRGWVYVIVDRYHQRGMDCLDRKPKSPLKATQEYLAQALALLRTSPQEEGWMRVTWSCELLSLQMQKTTGVSVHPDHLNRLLHREGMVWNRPRPVVYPPDPKTACVRLSEIIEVIENLGPEDVLVSEDEVDINLNPKIGAMWMPKGQQAEVVTPGNNVKRYLAGSLDLRTGELVWVEGEKKTSDLFISWLKQLDTHYPQNKTIYVILDNYKPHHSEKTRRCLEPLLKRIKLLFLPPYCPSCNPIENLWLQLHANVTRNHRCKTMKELMDNVHAFMQKASPFPGAMPSLAKRAA